jgi:predicted ATP-grasp superfamily ATP-dependent carboligase
MYKIGYRGILDIGYRLDPRDGLYKVLDINPRVGQAFRLFVAENGMDVVRALYLDLTGQKLFPVTPIEGRRWIIEDYDFIFSSFDYYREGTLGIIEWLKSFKGIEEGAWFSWKDPVPFLRMMQGYCKRFVSYIFRKCNFRT